MVAYNIEASLLKYKQRIGELDRWFSPKICALKGGFYLIAIISSGVIDPRLIPVTAGFLALTETCGILEYKMKKKTLGRAERLSLGHFTLN